MTARLEATTTSAALAAWLRDEINAGRWGPGAVLRQEELAAELSVSRLPIREALALLRSEGLVVVEHYRGARVVGLTAEDVEEIFDLRLILESELLRRAVGAHDARSVRALCRLQEQLDEEEERLAWISTDRAFHEALYAPACRPRSLAIVRQLRAPVERFSVQRLTPRTRGKAWRSEHHALIDAVRAKDVRAALRALKAHLETTRETVLTAAASPHERSS
jgi:DNA-binding GntR family transcriptional regulator